MHYAWIILISCCLIEAGSLGAVFNCFGVYIEPVCADLQISTVKYSLYLTLQNISMAIAMLFAGKIYKKLGIRKVILLCSCVISLAIMGLSFSNSIINFYFLGLLIGPCIGLIGFLPVPMLINNWFIQKQGFAIGLAMACGGISAAFFNMLYSGILTTFSWRTSMITTALISFLCIFPCTFFFIKNTPKDKQCLPFGIISNELCNNPTRTETAGISSEGVFKLPIFWITVLMAVTSGYASGLVNFLAAYGINIGLSIVESGSLLSFAMIGNMLGSVLLGLLIDKIKVQKTSLIATIVIILSIGIILIYQKNYILLLCASLCFGLSCAVPNTLTPLIVKHIFGLRNYQTIFPYISASTSFSVAGSFIVIGFLFDLTNNYLLGFLSGIVLYIIFACTSLFVLNKKYY